MIKFKHLSMSIIIGTSLLLYSKSTNAENTSDNIPKKQEEIVIDGVKEKLFIEFENQEDALNQIYNNNKNLLNYVQKQFRLKKLSNENWKTYYSLLNSRKLPKNYEKSIVDVLEFFDYYENKEQNQEIKMIISDMQNRNSEYKKEDLALLLPYYTEYSNKYLNRTFELNKEQENIIKNSNTKQESRDISIPNLTNAINYASKYAYTPNDKYRYIPDGDCANFVSQILYAGGVRHTLTWRVDTVYGNVSGKIYNKTSNAWVYANNFVKYWGPTIITTDHYNFSYHINKGAVIAYDRNGDGSWDHVGFVTQADSYTDYYGGKKFYDYKVAQHTKNYHAWASSSTNGWETLKDNYKNLKFGVIK